jgi:uncharacterized protein (DUF2267 family)
MMQSLNFDQYKAEANEWLYDVMDELQIDNRDQAGRIFRSVLHALRDRLEPDQAANFASQLPIIWKGIFYDQYNPASTPVRIRHVDDWLDFIREKDLFAEMNDFPTDMHVTTAFSCVIRALERRMDVGIIDKILNALPEEICALALEEV